MMNWLHSVLYAVAHNFGALCAIFAGALACIAYARGELGAVITFMYEMLCGADGKPSSKNAGYFMGAAMLCWSFTKITLAVCRAIDGGRLDPTTIFIVLVSAIAGLVGTVVLGASAIQAKLQAKLQGPPDAATQNIGKVENLTQDGPK